MKYLKVYIFIMLSIITLSIIFSSLSYINIISEFTKRILNSLAIFLSIFVGGYHLGKRTNQKGFLEGLKIGSLLTITFLVLGLLLNKSLNFSNLILYIIIISISLFGSIIGINKKTKAK